jgi:hypothetical protein
MSANACNLESCIGIIGHMVLKNSDGRVSNSIDFENRPIELIAFRLAVSYNIAYSLNEN